MWEMLSFNHWIGLMIMPCILNSNVYVIDLTKIVISASNHTIIRYQRSDKKPLPQSGNLVPTPKQTLPYSHSPRTAS
jgi:hypothetical protein